jgi:hypothetical protein
MRFASILLLAVCLPVSSAPLSREHDLGRPVISEEQVKDWVRVWQQRLKLDNWSIHTRIVRAYELKPDTLGNCKWDSEKRTATIRVLDPVDYDLPATSIPSDIEFTVVHELVHLQLSSLPRDPKHKEVEEDVVNGITDALLNLDRNRTQASVKH